MRRMDLKRTVTAFSLAAAMIISSIAMGGNMNTVEAASKKQNVITKAAYNDGRTVKYTYNKKGLVTKAVSTSSSKDNDSDTSKKITTIYKYNKKNKITTKTAKTVETVTSYDTDKTTGLTIKGTEGTITTTTTAVTKYTYNKKGLAKESVTTTTVTKSGSKTETNYHVSDSNGSIGYSYYDSEEGGFVYARELSDGRILAGFNNRYADGSYDYEKKSANAYFYNGALSDNQSVKTTVTTYTDNGDGTYKENNVETTQTTGVDTEEVKQYYAAAYDDQGDFAGYVPVTKYEEPISAGSSIMNTKYKDAAGKEYSYYSFYTIVSVNVTPNSASTTTDTNTTDSTVTDKTVTTTKYSYDKKKRVKKEVATSIRSDEKTSDVTNANTYQDNTGNSSSTVVSKKKETKESTSVTTTNYSYDKKGRAKKVVVSNDGIENSTTVESETRVSSNSESTSIASGFSKSSYIYTCKDAAGTDIYSDVTTTVINGGVKTITKVESPYSVSYSDSSSATGQTKSGTKTTTYNANGARKVVDSYTTTYSDGTTSAETDTDYYFAVNGTTKATIKTKINPSTGAVVSESYEYTDAKGWLYNADPDNAKKDAKTLMAAEVGAFEAAIAPYTDIETKAALATPSKKTTTYKYDKSGNVKSAKASGFKTDIVKQKDETYGETIYVFDATGKLQAVETPVTHTYTNKNAMENTVKKGTKNLTKVYTINTSTKDRKKDSGSLISRAAYTLKSKKASASGVAKKQQWILQNGGLNGQVGLN